jgi:outer membrane protein assembly factor BamB
VEPENGKVLWYKQLSPLIMSSVALGANNSVYVLAGGRYVYALDRKTGATLWSTEIAPYTREDFPTSTPVLRRSDELVLTFVYGDDAVPTGIVALNATGQQVWATRDVNGWISCTIAAAPNRMYLTNGGYFFGLNYTGHVVWKQPASPRSADPAAMVPAPSVVIGVDAYLVYGLNCSTGAQLWNFTQGGGAYNTPALCPCPPPSDLGSCAVSCF